MSMQIKPILSALRHHKAGVALIVLQIALTLAIVCNAVFIIGRRIERVNRPSGLDETNLFVVEQRWADAPAGHSQASMDKLDAMLREDLATLRGLPDVASATTITTLPLLNRTSIGFVSTKPGAGPGDNEDVYGAQYRGGGQIFRTLGLRLIAGRKFRSDDIHHSGPSNRHGPNVVIVTKAIADKLFHGGAVGKTVYLNSSSRPTTIIGVIQRMQVPSTASWADGFAWNSILIPERFDNASSLYAVRAKPGRLRAAMREVAPALYKTDPMRVLKDDGVRSFARIRSKAYSTDTGMVLLMGVICLIVIAATAAGIVGLTSFWVGQRRRQIGVRRALGATRGDILRYFQTENLLIAGVGTALGVVLAEGLNVLLMQHFEMHRMTAPYVLAGVVVVLVLSQAAVFAPARKASNVPPVEATRSV